MCGIVGWINWNKDLRSYKTIMESMSNTLYLRGPDASGFWDSEHVSFGHRRLIVVDPNGGVQPMAMKIGDHHFVLIYNGELYNTEDIRKELLVNGHRFVSHSDTEVLLHSYIEWGPDCVDRLNGIFAFAVWDEAQQSVFAARDRLGVKPLFYTLNDDGLLFASELKALLAHPSVKPVISREGIAELLMIGPGRTPGHGIFDDVYELKPGHSFIYDKNGFKSYPYWKLSSHEHEDDLETTIKTVRELVYDAVERQLVSDVPLVTLLSGGLDSSIITGIAANIYNARNEKLHTYSIDYLDNDLHFKPNQFQPNSDIYWINQVSSSFGTFHHERILDTPQLLQSLSEAVIARDVPGMADIDSSLYLFSQDIRKDAIVALSGECADEVFGGYPWFYRKDARSDTAFPWSRNISERLAFLKKDVIDYASPLLYLNQRYEEALSEVPTLPNEHPNDAKVREMFYLNLTRWMPTLLDRKDRMTMRASLEVRVPFCDHRIVEYAWNVPWSMKFLEGREKGLLRKAVKGLLPEEVLWRKKSPYPKTHNPDFFNGVRAMMLTTLKDPSAPIHQLIDSESVLSFAQASTPETHFPWFGQLMNAPQLFAYLFSLNLWLEHYNVSIK